jgi:hypothetical protein
MTSQRLAVHAAPARHFPWLSDKTGCAITSDFSAIEALDEGLRIRGMVGYCNHTPNSAQLHMAVDSPIVWRSLLLPALAYPFVELDRSVCLGIIPANNLPSIRLARGVGFRPVHTVKDGWTQGTDLVVLELRREDWILLGASSLKPKSIRPRPIEVAHG